MNVLIKATYVLLMCSSSFGYASGFEFKGLTLDEVVTEAEVEERLRLSCESLSMCEEWMQGAYKRMVVSCGGNPDGTVICNGLTSIAGARVSANVVIGKGGRLQRIWLSEISDYEYMGVLNELIRKYGKPSYVKKHPVQNAFGARYMQVESVWTRKNGQRLRASKYGSTVDNSEVYFSTRLDDEFMSRAFGGDANDL